MDKETLSHYGWIVILVLILAVMLALASPFGSFIAGAIKSTTAGLFNVNQAALGSAGIDVNDMVFENCDHLETEIRNATDTYTGDTCCKACGAVLQAGQTVRAKVPDGNQYIAADGTVYNPGDEFPETVTTGDKYLTPDYIYKYNQQLRQSYDISFLNYDEKWKTDETQNGWGVAYRKNTAVPTEMLKEINGKPITTLVYTFGERTITTSPTIPDTVTSMKHTFYSCKSLTKAPIIPESVTNLSGTFDYCSALKDISAIILTNNVTNMSCTFRGSGIEDASSLIIPSSVPELYATFSDCKSLKVLPDISKATGLNGRMGLNSTFQGCTSLEDISDFKIPSHINCLYLTFSDCTSLRDNGLFVIPSHITDLQSTFVRCTNLKDLSNYTIPKTTKLGGTFYQCTNLEKLPILEDGITDIGSAFWGCISLTDLSDYVIPSSVKYMESTFRECSALTVAPNIPNGILKINGIFQDCTSLTTVGTLSCSQIDSAFKNCTSLTGTITFAKNSSYYGNCFAGVDFEGQNLTLAGSCAQLDAIGATGTNYCAECNGKCNGGH